MKKKGGYNRKNFLLRVERVNEVYLEYARRGVFVEHIYRNHIKDQFLISRTTFFAYLSIPYKKELEEIERKENRNRQLNLFD